MTATSEEIPKSTAAQELPAPKVQIIEFDMPFGSMVAFMLKWAVAAIPALLLLALLRFIGSAITGSR